MEDSIILRHIEELSAEELQLEESHHGEALSAEQTARLHHLEVELDQAYDLLRQRRARRGAGLDPCCANVARDAAPVWIRTKRTSARRPSSRIIFSSSRNYRWT